MKAKNIRAATYVKGHARADDLKVIWKRTHKDYKGSHPDHCSIMVLRDGGSCSVPLRDLTDAEIDRKLPTS